MNELGSVGHADQEQPPYGRAIWSIRVICGPWKKSTLLPDNFHSAGRGPVMTFAWGVWDQESVAGADETPRWRNATPRWTVAGPGDIPQRSQGKLLPLWQPGRQDTRPGDPPRSIVGDQVVWIQPKLPGEHLTTVGFRPNPAESDNGVLYRLYCPHCQQMVGDLTPDHVADAQQVRGRTLHPILDTLRVKGTRQVTLKDLRRRIRHNA